MLRVSLGRCNFSICIGLHELDGVTQVQEVSHVICHFSPDASRLLVVFGGSLCWFRIGPIGDCHPQ